MNWITENLTLILICLGVLEITLRFIPTFKNLSLIEGIKQLMLFFHAVIDLIIPNKRKDEI